MAVRTTELVQRLSQRAADLERKRDLCDRLRSQIETFEGTGLGVIVATERQLLDELQGKLQARATLWRHWVTPRTLKRPRDRLPSWMSCSPTPHGTMARTCWAT